MERLAKGERFAAALWSCYGSRFTGLDAMEGEFRLYAAKDGVTAVREF
jgi:hypothetical protein